MRLDLDNLPRDTAVLHRLVRDMTGLVEHCDSEITRLRQIIKQLQRAQYGRRSERLDPDQLALALEELDTDIAEVMESGSVPPVAERTPAQRKPLPDHLVRKEVLLDIEDGSCSRCGGALHEIAKADGSPIAGEAVRRIAELYAIEARIRGNTSEERLAVRQAMAQPLIMELRQWLEAQLPRIPQRGKLAEAIRYALTRWSGLSRFLDDGRVELDTNPVERAIRPIALGRKNHLFAGSDRGAKRWATVCSLVETAKLNKVEPYSYLTDMLQRMVDDHPANRLDELLPWNWKAENPVDS